jgi:hypothetical protein
LQRTCAAPPCGLPPAREAIPNDERNTLIVSDDGHRRCRQCNRNRYHRRKLGHDFVVDLETSSIEREQCLTCRQARESAHLLD